MRKTRRDKLNDKPSFPEVLRALEYDGLGCSAVLKEIADTEEEACTALSESALPQT